MKALIKLGLILGVVILVVGCSDNSDQKEDKSEHEGGDSVGELEGTWNGSINVPNQALSINISFKKEDVWTGSISIPVQGVKDHALSDIILDQSDVSFVMEIPGQKLTFDGTIGNELIKGKFTQHGQTFPFELKKGEKEKSTEVDEGDFLSVDTNHGKLYGELEQPKGEGPYPVMIIIPGSGPTDRNGNSAGLPGKNNSLKLLAEALAEQGIASIRYDKRGVGKNQAVAISETDLQFNQFVKDANAWIELVKQDNQFSKVGVIGHSQGSLVGMIAAQTGVDTFISIAGAGRPIDEVLNNQLKESLSDDLMRESKGILTKLKQGEKVESVSKELQSVFRPSVQSFLSSWMKYDPTVKIKKLDIPVLIINGKHDIQVPVSDAEKLKHAKDDAKLLLIEKMNHVLKEAPEDKTGNMQTYSDPNLPLADGLVKGIMGFLEESGFLKK